MHRLPPEARLFMLAAAAPPEGANIEPMRALARGSLDWRLIGHLAEREKLVSVLSRGLRDIHDLVPDDIVVALDRRASVIEFRLALLQTALGRVVAELATIDVPVMLLKGAALASTIYPSFLDRPMGDLDILVPPDRAEDAWHHMRRMHWTREDESESEFHASYHHLQPLVDAQHGGAVLELHRAAMPAGGPFAFDEAELWRDARRMSLGTTPAFAPSDTHQLLHLCVHFAWSHTLRDGITRTSRDVAWLADRGAVDWPAFTALARRTKAGTCAYWTLTLAHTLTGGSVPIEVLAELRPPMPRSAAPMLERAFIMSALFRVCPSMRVSQWFWNAGMQPNRYGHGRARPWDVNDRYMALRHEPRATISTRVAAHLADIGQWLRFARIVVAGKTAL